MKRFTNSKISTTHNKTITEFSELNKFLAGGVTKGHNDIEYSWVADLLYKNTGNLSINPNIGYISFESDRNIMHQEYGNIKDIWDNYSFFSGLERAIFSQSSYELTTKQYSRVGQKYVEYDFIEYVNASGLFSKDSSDLDSESSGDASDTRVQHSFYRTPVFWATGYKLDLDHDNEYEFYDRYVWGDRNSFAKIGETFVDLQIHHEFSGEDLFGGNEDLFHNYEGDHFSLFSYKLHVDNPVYLPYDKGSHESVFYYNESEHYSERSFVPYYGALIIYNDVFEQVGTQYINFEDIGYTNDIAGSTLFFPEVIYGGKLEPAKIIINQGYKGVYKDPVTTNTRGSVVFNPGNHMGEATDQSRLVYNVCRRMINWGESYYEEPRFYLEHMDGPQENYFFQGIDIDTEKNRRYSPVVMTEPYMTVEPLGNGELVDYYFVDENNVPVNFNCIESDFIENSNIYLKVRAPLNVLGELDVELSKKEYNTDIISTLVIDNPTSDPFIPSESSLYNDLADGLWDYLKYGTNDSEFLKRQDHCVDNLIGTVPNGAIVGSGTHVKLWIEAFGSHISKYSDNEMKVCGLGYISYTKKDSITGVVTKNDKLHIYCTNYVAINSPPAGEGDVENTIPNQDLEFLDNADEYVSGYLSHERFRPMIKLPEMNGYVKIMERNKHFNTERTDDGRYEMVYNVEFPYCPGSFSTRVEMNFSLGKVLSGFIYRKKGYINSGSHEEGPDERFDSGNDRYAPYGDDSFTHHTFLAQSEEYGTISTDPHTTGGALSQKLSVPSKRVNYPANLVWEDILKIDRMSLIKSSHAEFARYGTYDMRFDELRRKGRVDAVIGNIVLGSSSLSTSGGYLKPYKRLVLDLTLNVPNSTEKEIVFSSNLTTGNSIGTPGESVKSIGTPRSASYTADNTFSIFRFSAKAGSATLSVYIEKLEIFQKGKLVDVTIFDDSERENGWKNVGGGTAEVSTYPYPSSQGQPNAFGLESESGGSPLVYQKILKRPLKISDGEIGFRVTLYSEFNYPGTIYRHELRLDIADYADEDRSVAAMLAVGPDEEPEDLDILIFDTEGADISESDSYVEYFSRDFKLFMLADNRQWRFAEDKFSSYIGRENPSYICEMDISALLDDYTKFQKDHGAIPDTKRWLFGYVSGFANVILNEDTSVVPLTGIVTENLFTLGNSNDIDTKKSKSDTIIEIWDSESDLGNNKKGNWRPFTSIESDINKIPGGLIVDNIYVSGHSGTTGDNPTVIFTPTNIDMQDVGYVYIGSLKGFDYKFPQYVHYNNNDQKDDILNEKSNLVLYNKDTQESIHIIYIKISSDPTGGGKETYKIYLNRDDLDLLPSHDPLALTGDDSDVNYEIRYASKFMSSNPSANTVSRQQLNATDSGFVTRFLDFRGGTGTKDFDRYVSNNKIFFRIRAVKSKKYLSSYFNEDKNLLSYTGSEVDSAGATDEYINSPWSDDTGETFDKAFDWSKIKLLESVRKFGLNYFKCASK